MTSEVAYSLYWGRTPTALSALQLEVPSDGLTKNLDLSILEELTIEANPGDLDEDKIAVFKEFSSQPCFIGCPNL